MIPRLANAPQTSFTNSSSTFHTFTSSFLTPFHHYAYRRKVILQKLGQVPPRTWLLLLFSRSVVSDSVTPWTAVHQASLSFTISWSLLKFMYTESVILSNYLILFHPLLLASIFPTIRVFSNELALLIRWRKYWGFSFSHYNLLYNTMIKI